MWVMACIINKLYNQVLNFPDERFVCAFITIVVRQDFLDGCFLNHLSILRPRQFFLKIHDLFDLHQKRAVNFREHGIFENMEPAYLTGLAFQIASVSAEPCERTPLSVRISSVAASICARGKTIVSP